MVSFIKNGLLPTVLAQLPLGLLQKWGGTIPLVPYYHGISDHQVPHVKHLYRFRSVQQFKNDLDAFTKHYHVITLHDLLNSLKGVQALPSNSLLLTFDDGFRENYDVALPILLEKGVSGTFFIISTCLDNADMPHHNKISLLVEQLDRSQNRRKSTRTKVSEILGECGANGPNLKAALLRLEYRHRHVLGAIANVLEVDFASYLATAKPYLSSDQVQVLIGKGFTIGSHSVDHPLYAALSLEEQLRQTRESVRLLRKRFQLNYGAFSFPHHDEGVGREFFERIYAGGDLDVSFGTSGIVEGPVKRHLQRFPMEKMSAPAEGIVAYNYVRSMQRRLVGRHTRARAAIERAMRRR